MERYIAVDNVCAWPNSTLMPDGAIVATIFNQPTHLRWPGDVECWASTDGGYLWSRRSQVTEHEPHTSRGNVAAGLAHDGALVVIVSGWSYKDETVVGRANELDKILDPWVCRSTDGGRTWKRKGSITIPQGVPAIVPFGDIERSPDGSLAFSAYSWYGGETTSAYLFRSRDDGQTWDEAVVIGADDYNETDILSLDEGRWLAAARTSVGRHLQLFISDDGGQSWANRGPLTLRNQHPAQLTRLSDGSILLTYGIRNPGLWGVGARLSDDRGETWGQPILLANFGEVKDGGYPSSVQLPDGTIVTAYYCIGIPEHQRYHMGVVRWQPKE